MIIFVGMFVVSGIYGWIAMILLGIAHAQIDPSIPAAGFDVTIGVGWLALLAVIVTWFVWEFLHDLFIGSNKKGT